MKVCYNDHVNFDLGLLKYLHPFEGAKFRAVYNAIKAQPAIDFISPDAEISQAMIEAFVDPLVKRYLQHKDHILRALEVPRLPFVNLNFLDKKILQPMRWGVAGTIVSAQEALKSGFCWNLSGGYHHASQHSIEGFCIYNDIGICYQELIKNGTLTDDDRILIIDTDVHHGNGNARTFMDNPHVTLLDIYNQDLYPQSPSTRERVDIGVPLNTGVGADEYLKRYQAALEQVSGGFRLAFVVAGTDVLACDKLGGFTLSIDDVVKREVITTQFLKDKDIPSVMLSGGGYSKESAAAIEKAILACV